MKKILFLLCLSITLLNCKKKETIKQEKIAFNKSEVIKTFLDSVKNNYGLVKLPIPTNQITCDSEEFRLILKLVDEYGNINYPQQLWWLRTFNGLVCNDDFYKCIIDYHTFKDGSIEFEKLARLHPENTTNIIYYKIAADDLKSFVYNNDFKNCYKYHVNFNLSKDGSNNTIATPNKLEFDPKLSCYSIPLLRGIILKLEEKNPDLSKINFEFCNAIIGKENKIIFKVEDINLKYTSFYNFTTDPKFAPILF